MVRLALTDRVVFDTFLQDYKDVLGLLIEPALMFGAVSVPSPMSDSGLSITLMATTAMRWLGDQDSNLDWRSQSPQSCR